MCSAALTQSIFYTILAKDTPQLTSREWNCSLSSADRRCSNYIWVINNVIASKGASYIRDFTVCKYLTNHYDAHVIHMPFLIIPNLSSNIAIWSFMILHKPCYMYWQPRHAIWKLTKNLGANSVGYYCRNGSQSSWITTIEHPLEGTQKFLKGNRFNHTEPIKT